MLTRLLPLVAIVAFTASQSSPAQEATPGIPPTNEPGLYRHFEDGVAVAQLDEEDMQGHPLATALDADELGPSAVVLVPLFLQPVGERQAGRVLFRVRDD